VVHSVKKNNNFTFLSHLFQAYYMPHPSHPQQSYMFIIRNYEAPHYAVFPTLLLLLPPYAQHLPGKYLINKPTLKYQNP
jgi:hypothetical protein